MLCAYVGTNPATFEAADLPAHGPTNRPAFRGANRPADAIANLPTHGAANLAILGTANSAYAAFSAAEFATFGAAKLSWKLGQLSVRYVLLGTEPQQTVLRAVPCWEAQQTRLH